MAKDDFKKPEEGQGTPNLLQGYLEDVVAPQTNAAGNPVPGRPGTTGDPSYNPSQDATVEVRSKARNTTNKAAKRFGQSRVNAAGSFNTTETKTKQEEPYTVIGDSRIAGPMLTGAQEKTVGRFQEMQLQADRAQMEWDLVASLAAERTSLQAADIADQDHEAMSTLVNEDFTRWRAQNEQFTEELEQASKLRVNPYAYMQNAGQGGRAASVLAVGLSQLAAGAGNTNTVLSRIKSAVDADVNAQAANIKLTYAGLAAQQGQQDREQVLLDSQIGYIDKLRALEYTAILGQLDAVMKHAQSETAYREMQMLRPRVAAEAALAAGTVRANATAILVEQAVARAHTALQKKNIAERMIATDRARVRAEDMGPGETFAPLSDLQGNPLDPQQQQMVRGQMAQEEMPQGVDLPQEQMAVPQQRTTRAAQRSRRVVQGSGQPTGTQVQGEPTSAPTEAPMATEEPAAPTEEITNAVPDAPGKQQLYQNASDMVEYQEEFEGYKRKPAHRDLLESQVLEIINGGRRGAANDGFGIAETPQDAIVLAEAYPPPNPDDYASARKFDEAYNEWEHRKRNTELFERPVSSPDGYSNHIKIGGGELLMIGMDQKDLRNSAEKRNEIASQYITSIEDAARISRAATELATTGSSDFLGIAFTKEGMRFRPGDGDLMASRALANSTLLANQGAVIRQVQGESARMSDADLSYAAKIGEAILNKKNITWDFMARIWAQFHPDNPKASRNEMAKAIRTFYGELAANMQLGAPEKYGIVPSYQNTKDQQSVVREYERAINNDVLDDDLLEANEADEEESVLQRVGSAMVPANVKAQLNILKTTIDGMIE